MGTQIGGCGPWEKKRTPSSVLELLRWTTWQLRWLVLLLWHTEPNYVTNSIPLPALRALPALNYFLVTSTNGRRNRFTNLLTYVSLLRLIWKLRVFTKLNVGRDDRPNSFQVMVRMLRMLRMLPRPFSTCLYKSGHSNCYTNLLTQFFSSNCRMLPRPFPTRFYKFAHPNCFTNLLTCLYKDFSENSKLSQNSTLDEMTDPYPFT